MANLSAVITRKFLLKEIPSASGIEMVGNTIYIVTDDSPFLYVLDHNLEIKRKVPLIPEALQSDGRMPKATKLDIESLTMIRGRGMDALLLLGSGSVKGKRDRGFLADLRADLTIREQNFHSLFEAFRHAAKKLNAAPLNIEGSVFFRSNLYFFHRGNISGKNLSFAFHWKDLLNTNAPNFSKMETLPFTLPAIGRVNAGFSGATVLGDTDKILFTASVEKTKSAVADGIVLGSFIGLIDLNSRTPTRPITARVKEKSGDYKGKLESIAIRKMVSKNECIALAISDSDSDSSEIAEVVIKWK